MNKLLTAIARALEFQLKEAKVQLNLGRVPPALGDATQTAQVFSNLLDNAIKYLDPVRPGIINIAGRKERERVIYKVEDNGIGIAPEHQEKVFEIFHRLNPSTGTGEGLGLTIAQRILARQNGKLWVESEPGRGSTFFVSLPAA